MDLREIQTVAKSRGMYPAKIDGLWGPASKAACIALILEQRVNARDWPQGRLTIGAGQAICRSMGIDAGLVDGFMGPQTRYAFEVYASRKATGQVPSPAETWRDEPAPAAKPPPAASIWPTQAQVPSFFGAVGANQVTMTFPYPMRLAWDLKTVVTRASCHAKVKVPFERIFQKTLDHYGIDGVQRLRLDRWGGCLNVRKMKGGSSWSMHSWGIAHDLDPDRNQLTWGRDRAEFAKAAYEPFWRIVEAEGMVSLGRARNFDWMHFQAARL